ncbi:MAG TPA: hypothetical protein VF472_23245 [Burkholderiaceae bacterium]
MRTGHTTSKRDLYKDFLDTVTVVVPEEQADLPLPYERDESQLSQSGGPHAVMRQAKFDIEHGIVDTDRRSAYGLGEGEGLQPEARRGKRLR